MKILTFGSCLSRFTANNLLKMFPGELLGSVFHNRSDAFIQNYMEATPQLPDYQSFIQSLQLEASTADSAMQVINNQYPHGIGLHDLPNQSRSLFPLLEQEELDLIILDNYMDIRPSLISPLDDPDSRIFFNTKYSSNFHERFKILNDALTPEQSVENWYRILAFLREKQPKAFMVFLQYPYNLYNEKVRTQRCQRFEKLFKPTTKGLTVIPPQFVIDEYRHQDPQHYKIPQYTFYAGIVYQFLRANKNAPFFKEPSSKRFNAWKAEQDEKLSLIEEPPLPLPSAQTEAELLKRHSSPSFQLV